MKKLLLLNLFMLFLAGLLLFSCNKDEEQAIDIDTSSAQDNNSAERIFNNVSNISDEAYNSLSTTFKSTEIDKFLLGNCATVTIDTLSDPRLLTIDFGEDNCLCGDGRYRRGKILVAFTGRYREQGTVLTHTFDGYYVNNNQVLGSRIVSNMGENNSGNVYFTVEVDGQIVKGDGTGTISWTSIRQREWIDGFETITWWDDVYLISGNAQGTSATGHSFTMEITTGLRKEIGCRYFVSGTYELTPEERPVRVVDYGDGECDNIITITINGQTITIHLPTGG